MTTLELIKRHQQDPRYTTSKIAEVSDLVADNIIDLEVFKNQIRQAWEGRHSGDVVLYDEEKWIPFIDPEIDGMLTRLSQVTFEKRHLIYERPPFKRRDLPKTYKQSMLYQLFFNHTRQELENIPGFLESLLDYNLEDRFRDEEDYPPDILEKKAALLHDSGYIFGLGNMHELHLIAMHGRFYDTRVGYSVKSFRLSRFAEWILSIKQHE